MSPTSPLSGQAVVVFGGLGRQGASVAIELLQQHSGLAELRLVTRAAADAEETQKRVKTAVLDKLGDDKAALAAKVKVVTADMGSRDAALDAAVAGCYGCFIVTAFWPAAVDFGTGASQPLDLHHERLCAENAFAACRASGTVKHVVFSTLEQTSVRGAKSCEQFLQRAQEKGLPLMDERAHSFVPHFDGKGLAADTLAAQDEIAVDFVCVGFYLENWFGMKPGKGPDGKYALFLPLEEDTTHYMVAASDTGKFVAPLFNRLPEKVRGGHPQDAGKDWWPVTGAVSAAVKPKQICAEFAKLVGEDVGYVCVPGPAWAQAGVENLGMPEAVANDFGNMFEFFNTNAYQEIRQRAYEQRPEGAVGFEAFLGAVGGMLYPAA